MVVFVAPRGERNASEAAISLLEHAYRTELGGELPEIKRMPLGKPYFPGFPDTHFSLSHSATHILCALSGSPVGCDIESPREITELALRYFCSPDELKLFEPLELWVLKESYVKLLGLTIATIRNLLLSLEDSKIVVTERIRQGDGSYVIEKCPPVFFKLYRMDGCIASVCSFDEHPPPDIESADLNFHAEI